MEEKKWAIIECNVVRFYDKENIVFISLPQCGSSAFLTNHNIHNLFFKECCVISRSLKYISEVVVGIWPFFFFKGEHKSVVFI